MWAKRTRNLLVLNDWCDHCQKSYFAAHAAEARQIAGGDAALAPWTMLGNVLLNLDQTLTKE